MPDCDGLVIRSRFPVDKSFLDSATRLKFIARAGAGLENIDLESAKDKEIQVFSVPEANRDAVGEHAIGMLLMLLNHLKRADNEVRDGIWKRAENRGTELRDKTVGIIGYGQMGSAFAEKLSGFGCRVIAYDKYHRVDLGGTRFARSCCNSNPTSSVSRAANRRNPVLFGSGIHVGACSKQFYLINTARGPVVKTSDLVEALKNGRIAGACLDVLEYESRSFEKLHAGSLPENFRYLIEADNVILSPHIAGWTRESHYKLSRFLGDKILAYFEPS